MLGEGMPKIPPKDLKMYLEGKELIAEWKVTGSKDTFSVSLGHVSKLKMIMFYLSLMWSEIKWTFKNIVKVIFYKEKKDVKEESE